jgi:hypothetical protein
MTNSIFYFNHIYYYYFEHFHHWYLHLHHLEYPLLFLLINLLFDLEILSDLILVYYLLNYSIHHHSFTNFISSSYTFHMINYLSYSLLNNTHYYPNNLHDFDLLYLDLQSLIILDLGFNWRKSHLNHQVQTKEYNFIN